MMIMATDSRLSRYCLLYLQYLFLYLKVKYLKMFSSEEQKAKPQAVFPMVAGENFQSSCLGLGKKNNRGTGYRICSIRRGGGGGGATKSFSSLNQGMKTP